jgi:DNA-binding transcriptional LysR family regulator
MTLDQLKIFIAVAQCEHITRASEALQLTQSTVSGAIQALEQRHAIALFNRVGRRIELSQEGRAFLDEARAVLRQAQVAEVALSELAGLKRGILNVHASQTIAHYWLPRRLVAFHEAHPEIAINLSIGNTAEVAEAVNSGAAEVGFVEGAVQHTDLKVEEVDVDRLILVVGNRHPWARRKSVKRSDIVTTSWILRERGSGTRSVFEDALRRLKVPLEQLRVTLEFPSNEAVRAAVEAGAGATAISHAVVESGLGVGRLHEVGFDLLERPFTVLTHQGRYQSHAARAFLAMLLPAKKAKSRQHRAGASRPSI